MRIWFTLFGWLVFFGLLPFYLSYAARCVSSETDIQVAIGGVMIFGLLASGGTLVYNTFRSFINE